MRGDRPGDGAAAALLALRSAGRAAHRVVPEHRQHQPPRGQEPPSKRAVGLIARDLLRLLFPGFFDEQLPHADELEPQVAALLHSVCQRLREEISKSLRCSPSCPALPEVPSLAGVITAEFLGALPEVREVLQTDVEAAFQGDPACAAIDEVILAYPFVEAVAIQRWRTSCTSRACRWCRAS